MSMDLTGITNCNEYFSNHYFSTIFEENAKDTISQWRAEAKGNTNIKTPWALLKEAVVKYYPIHNRFLGSRFDTQTLTNIQTLADIYLSALGYPDPEPFTAELNDGTKVPVYLELKKSGGVPALWVLLATSSDKEAAILDKFFFDSEKLTDTGISSVPADVLTNIENEDLVAKILFEQSEPPRFLLLIGMNQIALIDRNRWNEKRYLQFELEDIFSRREETTLQAMAVLLHRHSLVPDTDTALIDELGNNSQKHASEVSEDLKFSLREAIELLGNEVIFDMKNRQGKDLNQNPVNAGELTIECLRYMYRMLFVLFIEARPELGYAPIKAQSYLTGYSFESLRDIADQVRDDVAEVGNGYFLHETLSKLYDLIYNGYPESEEDIIKYAKEDSLHDMFVIAPLKAHIFDPEYTPMITSSKLRNSVMLKIIDLMSLTRETGKKGVRRGRISYANLGINQMGSVYEALLSYRGFIAEQTLFEVKRAKDNFNELDVGYFVPEGELNQYEEDERVRYEKDDPDGRYKKGDLRRYEKGAFIYRLAGRERETSASYYTPEVLTKCLVKYALLELLEGKTADEILKLTICEPAMGSAAFLNETINQLAENYLDRKQKELGKVISAEDRLQELQKVKMFIADRNIFGIDLNPIAVELAEVSLWLNTIFSGGFVPWFGTQLVNGNSLIGARRQVYSEAALMTASKGLHWYETAPERVPLGSERKKRSGNAQIYHFLLGDPGMCNYTDKVIKSLEPEKVKSIEDWRKGFSKPYTKVEIETLKDLSAAVDDLWEKQVKLRKQVEDSTRDSLSVFGHDDTVKDSHTTIRQKDQIFERLYKTEGAKNAGPYARLKFAMDYWCALWFWPIEKADLLPSRSEFLSDLNFILVGAYDTKQRKTVENYQFTFFPSEEEETIKEFTRLYPDKSVVDIGSLCTLFPRLDLVRKIARQNRFMHWELEFADLFAEHGGFDLIIGNPPWIKLEWNEQGVLSDKNPVFAIKNLSAVQTANFRIDALTDENTRKLYFSEYETMSGEQNFLNANQNYKILKGQQSNLFKCFLPVAWMFGNKTGISAFVHQEGVYDDPNGGPLRAELYPRLRKHFHFINELDLFDIHHNTNFSLNVYCNKKTDTFDTIANLFAVKTIDECYEKSAEHLVGGIKDDNNNWNLKGHPDRVIRVGKEELKLFATFFGGTDDYKTTRLPAIHTRHLLDVMQCFSEQKHILRDLQKRIFYTVMWDETNSQKDGTIAADKKAGVRYAHFPNSPTEMIYNGPHFGIANPLNKTPRRVCSKNSDYDTINLETIPESYLQRSNFHPDCTPAEYTKKVPSTPWGSKCYEDYRILTRNMLSISGERTLVSCIAPLYTGHVHAVFELQINNQWDTVLLSGYMASLCYDFYVKTIGKTSGGFSIYGSFPFMKTCHQNDIVLRALLLNCLTNNYSQLWNKCYRPVFTNNVWAKEDPRLDNGIFKKLKDEWSWEVPVRSDYSRRQLLIEIDVLTAMALGMTLDQLKAIYRIQFPVLRSYENDTWYDRNGRIVFTNNKSLTNIGFNRPEWENKIKGAAPGKTFTRTFTDDTLPGGPVERTIEYVAPFDLCDREKDYEQAWEFFENKYRQ